ncbi:MAG: PAS domain-containing sensor histidine kinase [Planctomycetota bacterium]|jgi:PAS domain S-box-containing protein
MHPVAYIEIVSALACLVAIAFLIRGWKRSGFLPAIPILLLILLALMMFYGIALFLEWSGFAERYHWHFIEDFASIFIPFIWAFVFYAIVKNAVEENLNASREHFQNLVESTSDWTWEVDAKGRYTYVSPQVQSILGYTAKEIIGKTPFDLMAPEEAKRVSAIFADILEKKEPFQNLENINLHKDGHEVILETNGVPVFDKKRNLTGYRGVDRDITGRLEAERLQKQQQEELDSVFRASPTGVGLVRDRKLIRGNARFFEVTGYPEEELTGMDPRRLYRSEQDYRAVGAKYIEALTKGFVRAETQFVRKDQAVIDVVVYISPLDRENADKGFVVVIQDVTEFKAARQQAMEEKTKAQLYLDVAGVMIVVLDINGRVKLINKKGCEILECGAEQIEGADWFKTFLPASYQQITWNAFERIIRGEEKSVEYFENPVRTYSGTEKLMAWHNRVLRDESGKIVGVISSGEDITEARAAEKAVRESGQRLRMALSAAQTGTWQWKAATHQETRDVNLNALLGLEAVETTQDGEEFYTYVHPEDRDAVREAFNQAVHGTGDYLTRFRIVRADGQTRWVLDQGKPFFDFNGKLEYVTGAIVDITEQVEYQQRYQNIIDSAPIGILTYELDADDRLVLTGSNEAANAILGVNFSVSTGKTIEEVFPELASTSLPDEYRRICKNGGTYHGDNFEYRDARVSGLYEFDAFRTSPGSIAVAFTDVTERKRAENTLRQVEKRRELALQGGDLGTWDWNFVTEKVIYDERWVSMLGYTLDELGQDYTTWERLVHPDDLLETVRVLNLHLEGKTDSYEAETRLKHKSGQWVWVLTKGQVIERDADGKPLRACGTHQDITERKQAEQKLRDSEAYLSGIVRLAPIGISVMKDRVYVSVNDRYSEITGYGKDELIGQTNRMMYELDADYAAVSQKIHGQIRDNGITNIETQIRRKNGTPAYILVSGIPLDPDNLDKGILFAGLDITERHQAQQQLKFTQFAIDHAGDAAYWMGPDAKFTYVNELACQSLGYTREELLSMAVPDIDPDFPADIWPDHWNEMRQKQSMRFESHHKKKDGTVFPVEITSNFVTYDNQEYICAFARDITERKVAEQEREVLMQQLKERNDELQSIVFTAAHDLRSPLVNIAGFTGELEKSLRQLEELLDGQRLGKQAVEKIDYLFKTDIAESMGFIRFGSQHMDMLLNGLMRLSMVGSVPIELSPVDMEEVFDGIIEGLQYQINENIVDISVPNDLPDCIGDFTMLTQIFSNLIDNAIKYCHPERDAIVEIGASIQDDMVKYTVTDNGIGIESAHLEKVFELFHRLDSRQEKEGQGLGLPIVRRILDRLGGSARIESVSGLGTTVHVRLPRA